MPTPCLQIFTVYCQEKRDKVGIMVIKSSVSDANSARLKIWQRKIPYVYLKQRPFEFIARSIIHLAEVTGRNDQSINKWRKLCTLNDLAEKNSVNLTKAEAIWIYSEKYYLFNLAEVTGRKGSCWFTTAKKCKTKVGSGLSKHQKQNKLCTNKHHIYLCWCFLMGQQSMQFFV